MEAGSPSPKETTRRRYCAKCQKHNIMKEVKGHKNRCFYRGCHCENCCIIELKRYITRVNVKRRRDEILEKELAARRARESPELESKSSEESLTQLEPPTLPKDAEIPPEVADLRVMPAHKELLDLDRGTSVETLNHPEPPTLPTEKDIPIDVRDRRPPHKKDLIHTNRRTSEDSLHQLEPPTHPKENGISSEISEIRTQKDLIQINRRTSEDSIHQLEPPTHPKENGISSEISEIRTQKAGKTTLPVGGESAQPDLATFRIQALRDEYKDLDGHKNSLFKKALFIEETRQWLNEGKLYLYQCV